MEIDVEIERIDNGYIITGNDSTRNRMFYPTLEDFANAWIIEELKERHKEISECKTPDAPFFFKLKTDL